jgi:transcription factor STE12
VPHDRLFLDALERDLKREKMGLEPTTVVSGEPALSFVYDPKRSLYEQFSKATGGVDGEGELEAAVRRADEARTEDGDSDAGASQSDAEMSSSEADEPSKSDAEGGSPSAAISKLPKPKSALHGTNSPFFSMFSLFEGSPTYKQRRKKIAKHRSPSALEGYHGVSDGPADYYGAMALHTMPAHMEPQIDRYGRDIGRLSAADMFMAQARGDFGPQSNPDLAASQKERQRRAMQAGQMAGNKGFYRPSGVVAGFDGVHHHHHHHQRRHPSYPHPHATALRDSPEAVGVYPGAPPTPSSSLQQQQQPLHVEHELGRPRIEQRHTFPMVAMSPEHAMRTNTQPFDAQVRGGPWPAGTEQQQIPLARTKAYVCPLFSCGRMFKMEEQLKRHLSTHTVEPTFQCPLCLRRRFSQEVSLRKHMRTCTMRGDEPADEADAESEGGEEFDGVGLGSIPDTAMCEVEIQGQVQEVQGGEEGLLMPAAHLTHSVLGGAVEDTQEIYYGDSNGSIVQPSPEHPQFIQDSPNHWNMMRSQPSPAFSTISMPSPSLSASYPQMNQMNDYTSMSAPAHKAAFDHANIYPPVSELNGGPGPIRRHRSATPSMSRYNETVRRPFTATEGSATRSYHPYAVAAHSADNSPMSYNIPLGYEASPQMVSLSRSSSHSRSSSASGHHLQDQMNQMLNIDQMEPEPGFAHLAAVAGPSAAAYGDMYRTGSPMQFGSAPQSSFDSDTQAMFHMSMEDSQPQVGQAYYAHHHNTL